MSVRRIYLDNVASFRHFELTEDLKKNCLIYGINGAGKSTMAHLLSLADQHRRKPTPDTEMLLKRYLRAHRSKESGSAPVHLTIDFSKGSESLTYEPDGDRLSLKGIGWMPIAVFNEDYTSRTIGPSIEINFQSGIPIGESNIELEKLDNTRDGLLNERSTRLKNIDDQVQSAAREYQEVGASKANTQDVINRQVMLQDSSPYPDNPEIVEQRKALGYGKVQDRLELLDSSQVTLKFNSQRYETACTAPTSPPGLDPDTERILTEYTAFFSSGVKVFDETNVDSCPFCRRVWPEAAEVVTAYKEYLHSNFNQARDDVSECKTQLEQYKRQILQQTSTVESKYQQTLPLGAKYSVDTAGWRPLVYDQARHDEILRLLDDKYNDMTTIVSIKDLLAALESSHVSCINTNNAIIRRITSGIDSVSATRAMLNTDLMKHYAARAWQNCSADRQALKIIETRLKDTVNRIATIEENTPPSDTIRAVFNGLTEFMTLQEYYLDENRKLQIRLDRDYDISTEGVRISSAQRKLLSLCYFFAEIVSQVKNLRDLRLFTLVFDDPVDSADYVYSFSIATLIERADLILAKILAQPRLRFAQTIVFTHNAAIFERLAARWADDIFRLRKEDSISRIARGERAINNYKEYIVEICKYYKNPVAQKRRVIYIGNLIRRVLEILASFDSLGNTNIQGLLDGMGKPRLALIANHLSHESFTRVLNPVGTHDELRQACGELLEVIKERHRWQYDTILKDILKDEEDAEAP